MAKRTKKRSGTVDRRLKKAGFKIEEPKNGPFKPISVRGLNLSRALDEARGRRAR